MIVGLVGLYKFKQLASSPGRTLKRHALGQALKVILDTFALGKWTINKTMRNFFNTMYRACVYTVDC